MKGKFNLKRRILIGLMLLSIIFLCFSVKSSVIPYGNKIFVDTLDSYFPPVASWNNHICYDNEGDRWYIIYAKDDGDWIYPVYAYSDSGDLTTWNTDSFNSYPIINDAHIGDLVFGSKVASVYDNENNIGHVIHSSVPMTFFYYFNYTIAEGGALVRGELLTFHNPSGAYTYDNVDICLSQDNKPMIVINYYKAGMNIYSFLCDSIDGYNGNWEIWHSTDIPTSRNLVSIIPTGNTSALIMYASAYTSGSLQAQKIIYGTTLDNSAFSAFSDESVNQHQVYTSVEYTVHYGSSYNTTHGCISYEAESDNDVYTFIFDFETLTKTGEYLTDENIATDTLGWCGVTMDDNEFFTVCQESASGSIYQDLKYNEQHVTGFSPFNKTQADFILEDFEYGNYQWGKPICISKFSINNLSLIAFVYNEDLYITYGIFEGEYAEGEEEEEGPTPDTFDWSGIKWILALIVAIIIISFAIYVKGGKR